MNEKLKPDEWATQLRLFLIGCHQEDRMVDRRELSPLEEWQCRVSGGALLKFLRFLTRPEYRRRHPELKEVAAAGKRLVCITEKVGALAAHDILRMFRPKAVWIYRDLWEEWLDESAWADPDLELHIEYWSEWKKTGRKGDNEHWHHCERYRLDASTERELQHLWCWADEELTLVRPDGGPDESGTETSHV